MNRKRNIRLTISLLVLIVLTIVIYTVSHRKNYAVTDPDIFQLDDYKAIDRVSLTSNAETIDIAFDGTRWRINEAHAADRQMIDLLFATLQQVKPRRPAPAALRDSIANALKASGVDVTLFSGTEAKKNFIAGGDARKTQAYFLDPETSDVYLVGIPGYRVYASGIFELDESGWRDKYVFGFNWRNFERMEVSFPEKPSDNFSVALTGSFFGIESNAETDTSRLNTFLDDVSLLTVVKYLNDNEMNADSLLRQKAQMQILIKDIGKREYSLGIYPARQLRNEVPGLINGRQAALFNPQDVKNLIKPKSYFLKK